MDTGVGDTLKSVGATIIGGTTASADTIDITVRSGAALSVTGTSGTLVSVTELVDGVVGAVVVGETLDTVVVDAEAEERVGASRVGAASNLAAGGGEVAVVSRTALRVRRTALALLADTELAGGAVGVSETLDTFMGRDIADTRWAASSGAASGLAAEGAVAVEAGAALGVELALVADVVDAESSDTRAVAVVVTLDAGHLG